MQFGTLPWRRSGTELLQALVERLFPGGGLPGSHPGGRGPQDLPPGAVSEPDPAQIHSGRLPRRRKTAGNGLPRLSDHGRLDRGRSQGSRSRRSEDRAAGDPPITGDATAGSPASARGPGVLLRRTVRGRHPLGQVHEQRRLRGQRRRGWNGGDRRSRGGDAFGLVSRPDRSGENLRSLSRRASGGGLPQCGPPQFHRRPGPGKAAADADSPVGSLHRFGVSPAGLPGRGGNPAHRRRGETVRGRSGPWKTKPPGGRAAGAVRIRGPLGLQVVRPAPGLQFQAHAGRDPNLPWLDSTGGRGKQAVGPPRRGDHHRFRKQSGQRPRQLLPASRRAHRPGGEHDPHLHGDLHQLRPLPQPPVGQMDAGRLLPPLQLLLPSRPKKTTWATVLPTIPTH